MFFPFKSLVFPIKSVIFMSFPQKDRGFHHFSSRNLWNRDGAIGVAAKTGRRRPALERYGWGRLRREPWRTIPLIGYDWLMWVKVILWKSTLLGWYVFFGIIDDCTILYPVPFNVFSFVFPGYVHPLVLNPPAWMIPTELQPENGCFSSALAPDELRPRRASWSRAVGPPR